MIAKSSTDIYFCTYNFTHTYNFMQTSAMLFSSSKIGHFGQILSGGFLGEVVVNNLTPPTPSQVQAWGAVVIQVLVGIVTIWATIRKALQKPEEVLKVPAAAVAAPAAVVSVQPFTAPTDADSAQ